MLGGSSVHLFPLAPLLSAEKGERRSWGRQMWGQSNDSADERCESGQRAGWLRLCRQKSIITHGEKPTVWLRPACHWQKPSRKGCGKWVSFLEMAHCFAWLWWVHSGEAQPQRLHPRIASRCWCAFPATVTEPNDAWASAHPIGKISLQVNMKMNFHEKMLFRWTGDFIVVLVWFKKF